MASYAPLKTSADGADPAPAPATSGTRKAIFLGLVSALALVLFLAQPETPPPRRVRVPARGAAGQLAQCPSGLPPPATPPAPTNPWASLDVQESVAVYDWLFDGARGLNLTRADVAQLSDNVLYHIEVRAGRRAAPRAPC
jgi:primary-amine oxidase